MEPFSSTAIGRRQFITAAGAAAVAVAAAPGREAQAAPAHFPKDFVWGFSTSSYQIEGAVQADGRGDSIWDVFGRIPGKIMNGDTGDVACDHYHRYAEDVALMARAGTGAYRFSVAWPRILPEGTGAVNAAGLDFYDRLVDTLLENGIAPWLCLYHWDLPQALQQRGGWLNRDIANWFADYATIVANRFGDRVTNWITLNEPNVVALFGHGLGGHAPDLRGRPGYLAAIHHQNLAQGRALLALRGLARPGWRLGTVVNAQPCVAPPAIRGAEAAALVWDAVWNRSCLDPLFRGAYPDILESSFAPLVRDGDLAEIQQPVDFLGLNYYSPMYQQPDPNGLFGTNFGPAPVGTKFTAMGWPVVPQALYQQLFDIKERYHNPPIYITENGADYQDKPGPEGRIEDPERIAFLRDHLQVCQQAIADGANLRGYFAWTLLDNFEWADGYRRHFGLVAVDRKTMARVPKASYYWYTEVIRANAVI